MSGAGPALRCGFSNPLVKQGRAVIPDLEKQGLNGQPEEACGTAGIPYIFSVYNSCSAV